MKSKQNGFTIPIVLSTIALLIAASGTYFYFKADSSPFVSASVSTSSITIKDSGSTNSAGFSLVINSDGSGTLNTDNTHLASSSIKQIPSGTLDYQTLQRNIVVIPSMQWQTSCAKSVSFGTTEVIIYDGQTSSDITCPPNTQPYQDLLQTVNTSVSQAESLN